MSLNRVDGFLGVLDRVIAEAEVSASCGGLLDGRVDDVFVDGYPDQSWNEGGDCHFGWDSDWNWSFDCDDVCFSQHDSSCGVDVDTDFWGVVDVRVDWDRDEFGLESDPALRGTFGEAVATLGESLERFAARLQNSGNLPLPCVYDRSAVTVEMDAQMCPTVVTEETAIPVYHSDGRHVGFTTEL